MTIDRRTFLADGALAGAAAALPSAALAQLATVPVTVDTGRVTGPLPHIWSECGGSDRAAITLRESWRHDLDRWRTEAGSSACASTAFSTTSWGERAVDHDPRHRAQFPERRPGL